MLIGDMLIGDMLIGDMLIDVFPEPSDQIDGRLREVCFPRSVFFRAGHLLRIFNLITSFCLKTRRAPPPPCFRRGGRP